MHAHESFVASRDEAPERWAGLSMMRMAVLGGGYQYVGIEENVHWLRFQDGINPFLAYVVKNPLPVRPRLRDALMHPQPVDLDHRWLLFNPLQKHAVGLLDSCD